MCPLKDIQGRLLWRKQQKSSPLVDSKPTKSSTIIKEAQTDAIFYEGMDNSNYSATT